MDFLLFLCPFLPTFPWHHFPTDSSANGALLLGVTVLFAQYVAEIPSLLFQYAFCRSCCPCLLPKENEFGMADRI